MRQDRTGVAEKALQSHLMAKRPFTFADIDHKGIKGTPHVITDADVEEMEAFLDLIAALVPIDPPGSAPGEKRPCHGPG